MTPFFKISLSWCGLEVKSWKPSFVSCNIFTGCNSQESFFSLKHVPASGHSFDTPETKDWCSSLKAYSSKGEANGARATADVKQSSVGVQTGYVLDRLVENLGPSRVHLEECVGAHLEGLSQQSFFYLLPGIPAYSSLVWQLSLPSSLKDKRRGWHNADTAVFASYQHLMPPSSILFSLFTDGTII